MLLNNDAVVTDGWLDQLIALSKRLKLEGETEDRTEAEHRSARWNAEDPTASGEGGTGEAGRSAWSGRCPTTPRRRSSSRTCPYGDLDAMHGSPGDGATSTAGSGSAAAKLSGFCLLIKRGVYEAIGGLDERFGLGFFDDDDLAVRARRAGFELAVAHDLFVHHFGSRTFAGNGIDAGRLLEDNAAAVRREVGALRVSRGGGSD